MYPGLCRFFAFVMTPLSYSSMTPSENISEWMPRSLCPLSAARHASGIPPMPICSVAPLSTRFSAMNVPICFSTPSPGGLRATPIFSFTATNGVINFTHTNVLRSPRTNNPRVSCVCEFVRAHTCVCACEFVRAFTHTLVPMRGDHNTPSIIVSKCEMWMTPSPNTRGIWVFTCNSSSRFADTCTSVSK